MAKSTFPTFWLDFFNITKEDTPEWLTRNFIAQAVYSGLKKNRPPSLRTLLRGDESDEIKALARRRYGSKFPNLRVDEELKRLEEEKLFARRSRDSNGRRIQKSEYRVVLHKIKTMKARRKEFADMHKTLRGRLRTPIYQNSVLNILSSKDAENSNIARMSVLFMMGHWFYRLNELIHDSSGKTLSELVDLYFDEQVASQLSDEKEKIVVREGIRCVEGILLEFGKYIVQFCEDCMFCSLTSKNNVEIDLQLLYLFPGIQMRTWLRFSNASTVAHMLKTQITQVFPFDVNPDPSNPSSRRIVGIAAKSRVRYQPFATSILRILKLKQDRGRAAHFNGLYLDKIMEKLIPYLENVPKFKY